MRASPCIVAVTLLTLVAACEPTSPRDTPPASSDEVRASVADVERSFASTMADRDLDAFASFLDDEAVFLTGDGILRGRDAIRAGWAPYFESPQAPFSWRPSRVVPLESGSLALSTGPVMDPDGTCVGTFTSVWRRADDGSWKIIFDRGSSSCDEN